MQEIIIKGTFSNILKKQIPLLVIFFFLALIYLGLALEKNPAHANQKYLPAIQFFLTAYGISLFIFIGYQYFLTQRKPILKLTPDGIYILKEDFFKWNTIYHFKIIYLNSRFQNARNQKTTFKKVKKLQINESEYDFTDQYSDFELEDIVEIIKKYKSKLQTNSKSDSLIKYEL